MKTVKKYLVVLFALTFAFMTSTPAQAIQAQNVQKVFDLNGDSSIYTDFGDIRELKVQSWTSRKFVYVYLYMNDAFNDAVVVQNAMEATLSLDLDNDGTEDYWIGTTGVYLSSSLFPVAVTQTDSSETVLGCSAYFGGGPGANGQWLGWALDPACLGVGEYFGARASVSRDQSYGTGALPLTSDFVPNEGFATFTNPLLQRFKTTSVPKLFGSGVVGVTLSSAPGNWDLGTSFKYQWLRDGVAIKGAIRSTYAIASGDVGRKISLAISGVKRGYLTKTTYSAALTISAASLVKTSVPTVSGTAKTGSTLTAVPGVWDAGVSITYQWFREGAAISGASTSTYVLVPGDVGKKLTVRVTGGKAGFVSVSNTSSQVVGAAASLVKTSVPTVSGTAKTGSTLTAVPGVWDAGVSFTYQWLRGGAAISGANKASYKLSSADKGKKISVKVTGLKDGFTPVTFESKSQNIG